MSEEDFLKLTITNAIVVGRMALRTARDQRDWLEQAIERGRLELRAHGLQQ